MSSDTTIKNTPENEILGALSKKAYRNLGDQLEPFELVFGSTLCEAGEPIDSVYFPDSGIVSLLASLGKQSVLEVGMVGRDGMVGLSAFLGKSRSVNRALVQGEGMARRMPVADFVDEISRNPELSRLLLLYSHDLITQISQSAVCYRFHKIDNRLARWLLMSADLMLSDAFRLTHDFLSHMLGVRREAVTTAAAQMQKQGIIRYARGKIQILDRPSLERAACSCYAILKEAR